MAALSQTLDVLSRLIAFDTVSARSNMELIDYVRDYLDAHGIAARLIPNEDGSKANLFTSIGPPTEGGIVLSGHTDVVPADLKDWDTDPFELVQRDGRCYGRGTCDMKGFIAAALALIPRLRAHKLERPVHLAFSYDEEIGCLGAPAMIEMIRREVPHPAAVIVGEPTDMRPVYGNKGISVFRTRVTGQEAHSSQPQRGASAVTVAADLVAELDRTMQRLADDADGESGFVPPYSTITVNRISGGTATNVLARHCEFEWDLRNLPGENPDELSERFSAHCTDEVLPRVRERAPQANIAIERLHAVPAFYAEPTEAVVALCADLADSEPSGVVNFASEAGQFQEAGFDTVLCGPGSIDQAHQPNEYVEETQLAKCVEFLDRVVERLK